MAAQTTESVSIGTYFGYGSTQGSYTWVRIKNAPEMGGTPSQVDMTDLSDRMYRYAQGVLSNEQKEFLANYIPSVYNTLNNLSGIQYCAVYYGDSAQGTPTGSYGKFTWQGTIAVKKNADSVNSAREMTIICTPSTAVAYAAE